MHERAEKEEEKSRKVCSEMDSEIEPIIIRLDENNDISDSSSNSYTVATNLLSKQITNESQSSTSSAHGSTILSPSPFPIPNLAAVEGGDNLQTTPSAPLINLTTSPSVLPQATSTTPLMNQPISQSASHQPNQSGSHWNPSLPAISLPTFRGSVDKWLEFYDLFNSLVHEDNSIPPIRKLFYLKGCLAGEAAGVISSIELSAQNYLTAWNLLKERYDDRKFIRDSYVKSLIDIPCISREFSTRLFLDQIQKNVRSLQALGEPVEHWNALLIVLLRDKFNNFLRERWEDYSNDLRNPTLNQMISFLNRRAQLESSKPQVTTPKGQNSQDKPKSFNSQSNSRSQHAYIATTSRNQCLHCEGNHYLSMCTKFLAMNPSQRYETSKKGGWCINCLRKGHRAAQCTSGNCRNCSQRHHTLLHFDKPNVGNSNVTDTALFPSPSSPSINLHAHVSSEAVLATALVDLINSQGKTKTCRVFLDAGSQAHFITESAAQFLNLELKSVNIAVSGLDDLSTTIKHSTTAVIKSRHNKYQKTVEFLVIPRINTTMPSIPINPALLEIPKNIPLADPEFFRPSTVDALIGVKLFYKLLSVGQIALKNHPNAVLQKTQLGWIVAGEIDNQSTAQNIVCHLSIRASSSDLDLSRFWELEEVPSNRVFSPEESACEEHYKLHTTRDNSGRYVVRLPFNHKIHRLGESYSSALRRLYSLEARFQKNQDLKRDYSGFLAEYLDLKHMSLSKDQESISSGFYLPHHAVFKHDSLTTKLRVVFDGSAKTSTGISLNDTLMVGPKLQDDLFVTLTRYRSHVYALTADVEKMYRQVRVHPDDAIYQKILFRENPHAPTLMYVLDTVTYGTASASYLAIRSLQQLAEDEGGPYPLASIALKRDFYVDDLLTGASTLIEAERLRDELIQLLEKAGFHLRKWASNHPSLITNYPEHPDSAHLSLDLEATVKTLGTHWNSRNDTLFYSVNLSASEAVSNRAILSQIAKLFDPLGLLGPVIVYAKIIIQLCWKLGVTWDESVPLDIHNMWVSYRDQLPSLERLSFPRCLIIPEPIDIQLHGFCDASEKAYGACIYVRSTDRQGMVHVRLICSKSRVAPVSTVSLPRLELCGALLLSRLCATVRESLLLKINDIHLWSDSTITLHWINTSPHLLKTFVANRVAEIQRLTGACHWRHTLS
ncbi:uncharacterized protein LOC130672924 [Microplitis mediator]|uniref:uncharacterized protein LOC130672924 n=1 Tax=Microplitis mediator TaxID=375433 RepID=UPI002556BA7D|nr:uncharacterized protein LOC130672924 [Microplitis mediator]